MAHIAADTPTVPKPNRIRKWIRTRFLEPTVRSLPKSKAVLDLCCGYGFYFSINPNARGVDGDAACVGHLRSKNYDVKLANILERIPFPDDEFEYVIAHDVLEHFQLEDLEKVFMEVRRVLRMGGYFVAIQPNFLGYEFGLATNAGHKLFVTREHILRLSANRGFVLRRQYAEPLPRSLGQYFRHNKEVFWLQKLVLDECSS